MKKRELTPEQAAAFEKLKMTEKVDKQASADNGDAIIVYKYVNDEMMLQLDGTESALTMGLLTIIQSICNTDFDLTTRFLENLLDIHKNAGINPGLMASEEIHEERAANDLETILKRIFDKL